MTFTCFGKTIENTKRFKRIGFGVAVFLICVILITILTATLVLKNKASYARNGETTTTARTKPRTTTTAMMTPVSTRKSISTTIMTSSMMNSTSTSRWSTSTASPFQYWTIDSYLSRPRAFYDAVMFSSGSVMACGGWINSSFVTWSCDVYTSSNTWMAGPEMNALRHRYTLTLFANKTKILAAGTGQIGYGQTAEVYDMASGTWTYTPMNMTAFRCFHSAMLLQNEQILIMGGFDDLDNRLSSAELFLPSSNSFIRTNSMNVARAVFTATLLSDGLTVLVAGGYNTNFAATASAELYNSGSWTYTSNNMTVPRIRHAAVLLRDGNILIAGGDDNYDSYTSAEIYNPTTRTFTPVGSMKYRRAQFTLTLLPSGKVLATDGTVWTTRTYPTTCELYDPVTKTWSDAPVLRADRRAGISVLLNNSVLTMGGITYGDRYIASCEKYSF